MKNMFKSICNGVFYLCICILISGCNDFSSEMDSYNLVTEQKLTKEEAIVVAGEYLTLINNQYKLNLDPKQAIELGITSSLYDEIISEITQTNEFIQKALGDPNIDIELMDPAKVDPKLLRSNR